MTHLVRHEVTIHLIRHGETPWNAEGRIQGQIAHVPLNERGRAQAQQVADALADRPIGAVIASDLVRAVETATPLAARLGLQIVLAPAMREKAFGSLEGLRDQDIPRATIAQLDAQWTDPDLVVDGAESQRALYDRIATYLRTVVAAPPADEIAVFAHGGSVRVGAAFLAGITIEEMPRLPVENGSIHTFTVPVTG